MSQSANRSSSQEVLETARRGWAKPLREDAFGASQSAFARAGFSDPALVLRWAAIVGDEVARIAIPVKLQEDKNGAVLTLKCDAGSAVFLQHQTRALAERVNAYLGAGRIARIKCVAGERQVVDEPPPHPGQTLPPPPSDRKLELSEALDRLSELRARLAHSRVKRRPD